MGERVQENLTASEPQGLGGADGSGASRYGPDEAGLQAIEHFVVAGPAAIPFEDHGPGSLRAPGLNISQENHLTEVVAPSLHRQARGAQRFDAVPHHNRRGTSMPSSIKWFQTTTGSLEPLGAHGGREEMPVCQRNDNIGHLGSDLIRPASVAAGRGPGGSHWEVSRDPTAAERQRASRTPLHGPKGLHHLARGTMTLPKSNDIVLRITSDPVISPEDVGSSALPESKFPRFIPPERIVGIGRRENLRFNRTVPATFVTGPTRSTNSSLPANVTTVRQADMYPMTMTDRRNGEATGLRVLPPDASFSLLMQSKPLGLLKNDRRIVKTLQECIKHEDQPDTSGETKQGAKARELAEYIRQGHENYSVAKDALRTISKKYRLGNGNAITWKTPRYVSHQKVRQVDFQGAKVDIKPRPIATDNMAKMPGVESQRARPSVTKRPGTTMSMRRKNAGFVTPSWMSDPLAMSRSSNTYDPTDYSASLLVKQAAARAQEVTVDRQIISLKNQIEVAKQLEMAKSGDAQQTEGQKVARDQTIRLQSLLKLAMEAQTLTKDQSRLLNRVDIYRSLQEAKQLPDFEPRVGTPMIPAGEFEVDVRRQVFNLCRSELIHILQRCGVKGTKTDDPLCRLHHTDLAQLVLSNALARAFFMEYSKPGKLLNGGGKCKSEEAGWLLALNRGGRITPEKKVEPTWKKQQRENAEKGLTSLGLARATRPKSVEIATARSYSAKEGTNVQNFWRTGKPAAAHHAPVAFDQQQFNRPSSCCQTPNFADGKSISWGTDPAVLTTLKGDPVVASHAKDHLKPYQRLRTSTDMQQEDARTY